MLCQDYPRARPGQFLQTYEPEALQEGFGCREARRIGTGKLLREKSKPATCAGCAHAKFDDSGTRGEWCAIRIRGTTLHAFANVTKNLARA